MVKAVFGFPGCGWSLLFEHPVSTQSASRLDEVLPLLESAEAAAKSGFWVVLMLGYEAAPAFDRALKTHPTKSIPLAWAAIFEKPSEAIESKNGHSYQASTWIPLIRRADYAESISQIQLLIVEGYTYQVNYTFPLVSVFEGDPEAWYSDLCAAQGADYCVYLDQGRYKILSLSPELFFERSSSSIRTKPMKGTINRGRWALEDEERAEVLAKSAKDRAENIMIVDLLRNDLGRVSIPGSVRVTRLCDVERFETLWQMTSTVESTLRSEIGLVDVMAAVFPCGSVTGAPKVRTMEIIRQLEPYPRGIYTGTIGFLRPGGNCVFNVAIRTIVLDSETGRATFGVGGGITFDSTAELEYEECLVKRSFLDVPAESFRLLETMLLEDGEVFLRQRHVDRLRASAKYFDFSFREEQVLGEIASVARTHSQCRWKVRLLLSKDGEVQSEVVKLLSDRKDPRRAALAGKPIDSTNRFLFHKTTNRAVYEEALAGRPDCDDVILWNERGEITESTVANVVVLIEGQLYTPPLESGLLPGTFRAELLEQGQIRERVIQAKVLREAECFLINSVQRWARAILVN